MHHRLLHTYLLAVAIALFAPPALAESSVVQGEEVWQIILTPVSGVFKDLQNFQNYSNESNSQRVLEATPNRVVIERSVNYAPFHHTLALTDTGIYASNPECSPYLEKPTSEILLSRADVLAQGLSTQVEYVNAAMYEVRNRLEWRSSPVVEPEAVYKAGFTMCGGFANLAVAFLRAKGIPARVGYVLTLRHPSWAAGGHREVEVYYQGLGWISYDPQMHEHHGPYPRIYFGHGKDSSIWSNDESLWATAMYFEKLRYNVQYRQVKDDTQLLALTDKPTKSDFVSREDGTGSRIPTIGGTVYDGKGKPTQGQQIFFSLDSSSTSYGSSPLRNGSFVIKNDPDGGTLFLEEKGFVVMYEFAGFQTEAVITHDIRFDETDSIIVKTGKPGSTVKWYKLPNTYYEFTTDSSGTLRLHVNPAARGYRVDDATYKFQDGKWKKTS